MLCLLELQALPARENQLDLTLTWLGFRQVIFEIKITPKPMKDQPIMEIFEPPLPIPFLKPVPKKQLRQKICNYVETSISSETRIGL